MTPEEKFKSWKESLKRPYDHVFEHHESFEMLMLGFAMYHMASRTVLKWLKDRQFKLVHTYNKNINEMVALWILDENHDEFCNLFDKVMDMTEELNGKLTLLTLSSKYKKTSDILAAMICLWTSLAGDMNKRLSAMLLDDLYVDTYEDGTHIIGSDKIEKLIPALQPTIARVNLKITDEQLISFQDRIIDVLIVNR